MKPKVSVPHRKEVMSDPKVLHEIEKKFRKGSKANQLLKGLRLNEDNEESIFKSQDIWNEYAKLKARTIGAYTPTQALMKHLTESEA